jgi:hypothetical protein
MTIRSDLVGSAVLVAVGCVVLFAVIPAQISDTSAIGLPPRGMPIFTMGTVTLLSAILFVKTLISRKEPVSFSFNRPQLTAMMIGVAITLIATLLLGFAGFFTSGLFVIVALMLFMGERNWRILTTVPVATVAATYLFVTRILHVTVP